MTDPDFRFALHGTYYLCSPETPEAQAFLTERVGDGYTTGPVAVQPPDVLALARMLVAEGFSVALRPEELVH